MVINHIREKLHKAEIILRTGSGNIKEKLLKAWMRISTITTQVASLPEDIRNDFNVIYQGLQTTSPVGDEGIIPASIKAMSDEEAERIAGNIRALYQKVLSG